MGKNPVLDLVTAELGEFNHLFCDSVSSLVSGEEALVDIYHTYIYLNLSRSIGNMIFFFCVENIFLYFFSVILK